MSTTIWFSLNLDGNDSVEYRESVSMETLSRLSQSPSASHNQPNEKQQIRNSRILERSSFDDLNIKSQHEVTQLPFAQNIH